MNFQLNHFSLIEVKKYKIDRERRENLISLYIFNSFVRSFESSFALMKQKIYIFIRRERERVK